MDLSPPRILFRRGPQLRPDAALGARPNSRRPGAAIPRLPRPDDTTARYRADVPRDVVARRISEMAHAIDYSNFKDAAPDDRHDAYLDVWSAMYREQLTRRKRPFAGALK